MLETAVPTGGIAGAFDFRNKARERISAVNNRVLILPSPKALRDGAERHDIRVSQSRRSASLKLLPIFCAIVAPLGLTSRL